MSNTTQEFSAFKMLADTAAVKNPKLTIVDGAQGGQTAAIISDSNANFWNVIDQRLASAGVTRQQVQVAWVKEANASPTQGFPRHAQILDSQFVLIARILKIKYPHIKIAYWSSRIYAGYATTNLNPEPYAYENAFAVKWTIERQVNGDTLLRYSGTNPKAPWLSWGPYLWADGLIPRNDSLIWLCSDFSSDGTHPSPNGRLKVARMLLNFFKTDPTAVPWFTRANTGDTISVPVFLRAGWNLASLPVITSDSIWNIFPCLVPGRYPYCFSYSGGYVQRPPQRGEGFYLKCLSDTLVFIRGAVLLRDSILVATNWNLIGSILFPVDTSAIVTDPAGIRRSNYFGYDGSYVMDSVIVPGTGHWVKASQAGRFLLVTPLE
jgi:hypothetical protein